MIRSLYAVLGAFILHIGIDGLLAFLGKKLMGLMHGLLANPLLPETLHNTRAKLIESIRLTILTFGLSIE